MEFGKRLQDIYFGEEGIVNKKFPEVAEKALSFPGRAAAAAVGAAAPVMAAPGAYKTFRDVADLPQSEAAQKTAEHTKEEVSTNVQDAMKGDVVRRPVNAIARSDRLSKAQKFGGIAALKAMELGTQAGGSYAAGKVVQKGAEAANKVAEDLRVLNIKSSPMPESILRNEQKHVIDQIIGHPENATSGLYHPEKKPAADAIIKAMEKSKGVPLTKFSASVKENIPSKYLSDPRVSQSVDNWLGQVDNIVEITKTLPKEQQNYHTFSFISSVLKDKQMTKETLEPLKNMLKNLGR